MFCEEYLMFERLCQGPTPQGEPLILVSVSNYITFSLVQLLQFDSYASGDIL